MLAAYERRIRRSEQRVRGELAAHCGQPLGDLLEQLHVSVECAGHDWMRQVRRTLYANGGIVDALPREA